MHKGIGTPSVELMRIKAEGDDVPSRPGWTGSARYFDGGRATRSWRGRAG